MTVRTSVLDKDASRSFAAAWRAQAQLREQTSGDHLLHALLLGKDPLSAFSPVTNAIKLSNGQAPQAGLQQALNAIQGYQGSKLRETAARLTPAGLDDASFARLKLATAALQSSLTAMKGL